MNERIKQIANEVGISYEYLNNTKQWVLIEKFAELIVKECSKVIHDGGYTRGAFGYEALRPGEIATMIEEHFGVE